MSVEQNVWTRVTRRNSQHFVVLWVLTGPEAEVTYRYPGVASLQVRGGKVAFRFRVQQYFQHWMVV